ncbi:MAG: hypothetical protein MJ252_01520 [archaeon]|nr:hypothetical protein [archaeon]
MSLNLSFKKDVDLSSSLNVVDQPYDTKSPFMFLRYWPSIHSEFFQGNLTNNCQKKDIIIEKLSKYGKEKFIIFSSIIYF